MFSLLQHGSLGLMTTITFFLFWASIVHAETKGISGLSSDQAAQDVQDAKALGVDAFALNLQSTTEEWSTDAVTKLFAAANDNDFKLFFSFDMTAFTEPSQFLPYLVEYISNDAYYMHDNLPFVSTFGGGDMTFGSSTPNEGWQSQYVDALSALGHTSYFVPSFSSDGQYSGPSFYDSFPIANGGFSWSCWPATNAHEAISSLIDEAYILARPTNKTYIMGVSPLQFKHISGDQNWYRSGTANLLYRISQVVALQPDFVELISWNDNGESHYFGNIWPDAEAASYSEGFNHTGWQALLPALIKAYKSGDTSISDLLPTNGEDIQGTFWHHTLTLDADCSGDSLGKPLGVEDVQDMVSIGMYVSSTAATSNFTMKAWSGDSLAAEDAITSPGLQWWTVPMSEGIQKVEVIDGEGNSVYSGQGSIATTSQSDVCNYNFQVVEIEPVGTATSKREVLERSEEVKSARGMKHLHRHLHGR